MRIFLDDESSPIENTLRANGLAGKVGASMGSRASQARQRIREEMERQKLSQREVADLLQWSQSRVGKILIGRVGLDVDDLEALCFAVGISLTEAVRDRGFEFCAEMTPTELRLLERIRQLPQEDVDALMRLLAVNTKTRPQQRGSAPVVQKRKRSV